MLLRAANAACDSLRGRKWRKAGLWSDFPSFPFGVQEWWSFFWRFKGCKCDWVCRHKSCAACSTHHRSKKEQGTAVPAKTTWECSLGIKCCTSFPKLFAVLVLPQGFHWEGKDVALWGCSMGRECRAPGCSCSVTRKLGKILLHHFKQSQGKAGFLGSLLFVPLLLFRASTVLVIPLSGCVSRAQMIIVGKCWNTYPEMKKILCLTCSGHHRCMFNGLLFWMLLNLQLWVCSCALPVPA